MTTAEIHTKTETERYNKSSGRRSARLGSALLPLGQLLRDFQSSRFPKPVRVHIALLHLMASAPSVLMSDTAGTAAVAAARGCLAPWQMLSPLSTYCQQHVENENITLSQTS
ncbi:hypothetical protein ILYODFUR_017164 [Ilyodon furcidens]|uniref:Uncharacterized protein n=1 Tax=Ilyodon furcidens TaxID=33524 RepID=A0ABV0UW19_9TELE